MNRLIESILAEKSAEVCTGAERRRRNSERERAETAAVRVQRLVSGVAQKRAGDCRKMHIAVLRQNQFRYQQIRQHRLVEIVTDLETCIAFSADKTPELKRSVS